MGRSSPPPKGAQPRFRRMSIVIKTAGWMKTPLGTEVDLGPCHIVLDGVPALPRERGTAAHPLFLDHVYCGHGRPSQILLSSCNLPHLHLAPLLRATPVEFCRDLWHQKTRVLGYRVALFA